MPHDRHRLIIVSGPSCSGKSPLKDALNREFPELAASLRSPVLYNSRDQRADETDGEHYHFRSREEVDAMRDDPRFLVLPVRDDLQAVDLEELASMLRDGDVFYEGNVHVGLALRDRPELAHAEVLDIFLAPLSAAEIRELREADAEVDDVVTDMTRRRLLRRKLSKKTILALPDLEDVETRADGAYESLRHAHEFSYVIPNHDGEDSDNWDVFPRTLGDARRALLALAALLRGDRPSYVETWPANLIG